MPSDWKLASPSSVSQPRVLLNRRRGTMGTTIWRSFCLVFKGWPWTSNLPASTSWMLGVFHMTKNKPGVVAHAPNFLALGGWGWKVQAKLVWTTQKNKIYFLGERSQWAHLLSTQVPPCAQGSRIKLFSHCTVHGCYILRAQCGLSGPGCKEQYNCNNNLQANNLPPNSGLPWKFPKASQSNYRVDRQGPWPAMKPFLCPAFFRTESKSLQGSNDCRV